MAIEGVRKRVGGGWCHMLIRGVWFTSIIKEEGVNVGGE
jgi:hypothetical protein